MTLAGPREVKPGADARLHLRIVGRVQGVFYRATTQKAARALALYGWVRNCRDGGVELVAEGQVADCESLLEHCQRGPPGALVTEIDTEWGEPTGEFTDFEVRY